jgi:hypothetical protein
MRLAARELLPARTAWFGAPIASAAVALCLSGCSLFEALGGMPHASAVVDAGRLPTPRVFGCVEQAIAALNQQRALWTTTVTRRDEAAGVMETGHFAEPEITGFRVRATHAPGAGRVELELKGAGPYYVDLGVAEGIGQLKAGVARCLAAGA